MADLKDANEEIAKISKNIATDAPKQNLRTISKTTNTRGENKWQLIYYTHF